MALSYEIAILNVSLCPFSNQDRKRSSMKVKNKNQIKTYACLMQVVVKSLCPSFENVS